MPVQMVDEGKTFPSVTATDEQKQLVMDGADNLMKKAKEQDLNFFLGVFEKDKDGVPGVTLTGRGNPNEMILFAESLLSKAERVQPPLMGGFLDTLKEIFGAESVVVVEDGSELEGMSLDQAMKGLIESDHPALKELDRVIEKRVDEIVGSKEEQAPVTSDEVATLHEEMPKRKHPDEG